MAIGSNSANFADMETRIKTTWLGQGGFLFETSNLRLAVDPYLSEDCFERSKNEGFKRLVPAPMGVAELNPDYYCITHDHADHYDAPTVFSAAHKFQSAKFIGAKSAREHYIKVGFNPFKFTGLSAGDRYEDGKVVIFAVPAKHSDPQSIGFVFSISGKNIYVSGDTLYYPALTDEIVEIFPRKIDSMFICINGKLGNMTWQEAVKTVSKLKPQKVFPMHYGLFHANTVDPTGFLEAVRKLGIECSEPSYKPFFI